MKNVFFTVFFILLSASIYAEDFDENAVDIFSLSLQDLQTITVASLHKDTIYTAPASVTLITRQQIKQMGITSLQSLLNFVPGFQSTRDTEQGLANRIVARGRSTALSESVLVLIDGQRLNDLYTGGISILNRMLTTNNVEKIEIIRGPGSALYGSNAFLGVINIITQSHLNEVILSGNSLNGGSASVLLNKSFSKQQNLDLFFNIFKDKGESYKITDVHGVTERTKDPAKGLDGYLKYQYKNWSLNARYMRRQLDDFMVFSALGNDINKEKTSQWSVIIDYSKQLTTKLDYSVVISHNENTWRSLATLIPPNIEISPNFSLTERFVGGPLLDSNRSEIKVSANYQINQSHQLSLGSAYQIAKLTDVATAVTHDLATLEYLGQLVYLRGDAAFNDKKSRIIKSIFIQDQYAINKQLHLTTGIRYDKYSDFGQSVNPRIALLWTPKRKNSFKFIYATAFRAPNFLELYDRNNVADFGYPNLKAEKVTTTEIAWLTTGNKWNFEITAFANNFKNVIELAGVVEHINNPFGAPSFIQKNNQQSQGIETAYQIKLSDALQIKALWNWFTPKADINIERNSGALVIDYQWQNTHFNLNSYYRGKNKHIINQSAYSVTNINIRQQLMHNKTLVLTINNLFDKNFMTQSKPFPQGVVNRGRVIKLAIEFDF